QGSELFSQLGDPQSRPEQPFHPHVRVPKKKVDVRIKFPSSPETEDPLYATDIVLFGDCSQNPDHVAVPKEHVPVALCEHVQAVAVMEKDGEMLETGLAVSWDVDNEELVSLNCLAGGDHCELLGHADIFDTQGYSEPKSWIRVCAKNQCPSSTPDCKPFACNSLITYTVINVEGEWTFNGLYLEDETVLLSQDGRLFEGETLITDGLVINKAVEFRLGDYAYMGTLASDRKSMSGEVIDLLSGEPISTWSAVRLTIQ
ncbi:MAG: hypothetical protein NUV81_03170, partial [bacterium]|nr:hypothetical protein [bacterium]